MQEFGQHKAWLLKLAMCLAVVIMDTVAPSALSQQTSGPLASTQGLPGAGASSGESGHGPPPQMALAMIAGTVLDTDGAVVAGAQVILTGGANKELTSGDNGEFSFSGLPSGTFTVTITGPGMRPVVFPDISLSPGDTCLLPRIVLPFAAANTTIRVVADREELAEEQVHLELQQRVLGVLPNFYSSYDWNAAPLVARQKFELAFRSESDPVAFMGAGILAGIEQANNSFAGYGPGVRGYAKRFGAAYTDDFVGRMMGSAILPSLFRQDPRYFYKGSGSIRSRTLYAIAATFVCKGDNGHWEPNYSHILGTFSAGGISNLYYPSASRGVTLTLVNALIETAGNSGNNLLREFFMRRLTSKVPDYENGKP